jgi:MYXO-CTERM domain-containing protein
LHAESDENHRPYPMVHVDIPTPLVNSFMVYLDVDFDELGGGDWIHVGTWANNEDWDVHTMSVVNGKLEMAHVEDAESIPDELPDFPIRQWVRLTVYIHYAPEGEGTVFVWQDGEPMLQGRYTVMDGQNLLRAHWGMYAPGNITSGAQYNDDVRIWTLSEPLTDFDTEPVSPYGAPSPNPTPEAGTGGSAGADAGTDPPANNSGSGGRASTAGQGGRAGGSSGIGGRGGSGGSTSSGGRAGASGSAGGSGGSTGGAASDDAEADDSGCSVAAGPGAGSSSGALSLLIAGIAVLYGRRRALARDRR